MEYVHKHYFHIELFACSLGAYFSMMAYKDEDIKRCFFLSPVLNMQRIIENMMEWFHIDELMLYKQKEIATPIGQTLHYDYYCYVKENNVIWNHPTYILYGNRDDMCKYDILDMFVKTHHCELTIMEDGEYFFHTLNQFEFYRQWLKTHV